MKKNKGFTLVEVAIGGAMMVAIGGAIAGLQYIMIQNQLSIFGGTTKVEYANSTARELVREIRTARDGDNGAYVIEAASANSITFYTDSDFDGKAEKIRYFLSGTDLKKGIIKPVGYPVTYPTNTEIIKTTAENVRNSSTPIFYYFNSSFPTDTINNPLNSPIDISKIAMIQIYLRINPKNDPKSDYIVDSAAEIRTIKNNL